MSAQDVRELHHETAWGECAECGRVAEASASGDGQLTFETWPCPTIKALEA